MCDQTEIRKQFTTYDPKLESSDSSQHPSCTRTIDSKNSLDEHSEVSTKAGGTDHNDKPSLKSLPRLLTSPSSLNALARNLRDSNISDSTESSYNVSPSVFSHVSPGTGSITSASSTVLSPVSSTTSSVISHYVISSPQFSPVSSFTGSIQSPRTPQSANSSSDQSEASASEHQPSEEANLELITSTELAETWSNAINLANLGRHESARLLFRQLTSRHGVPPHLHPLLVINSGLLMIREKFLFPALHMFHLVFQEMCYADPLKILLFFAMGVTSWNLAFIRGPFMEPDGTYKNHKSGKTAKEQTLEKATVFFKIALDVLGEKDVINYACFGLDFAIKRSMILENINACTQAITLLHEPWPQVELVLLSIQELPSRALFVPIDLLPLSNTLSTEMEPHQPTHPRMEMNHGVLEDDRLARLIREVAHSYWQGLGKPEKNESLMKPLPPLPASRGSR